LADGSTVKRGKVMETMLSIKGNKGRFVKQVVNLKPLPSL